MAKNIALTRVGGGRLFVRKDVVQALSEPAPETVSTSYDQRLASAVKAVQDGMTPDEAAAYTIVYLSGTPVGLSVTESMNHIHKLLGWKRTT